MKRVLTIGSVMKDIFIQGDVSESLQLQATDGDHAYTLFEEGRKIEVADVVHRVGGGAANSAVCFARLGFEVSTICKMGSGTDADFITQHLKKEGINERFFIRTDKQRTGTSFIIPSSAANRTILVYRGANSILAQEDIPAKAFADSDIVYITSLTKHAAHLLPFIVQQAKKHKLLVATNPGSSQLTAHAPILAQVLSSIDILILNSHEAGLLMQAASLPSTSKNELIPKNNTGYVPELLTHPIGSAVPCYSLPDFMRYILQQGPRLVIVTNGKEGVYVAYEKCLIFYRSIAQNIVSTVGAGDAFASTFVALYTLGIAYKEAIPLALTNCASVLEYLGAQEGLLSQDVLNAKRETIGSIESYIYQL